MKFIKIDRIKCLFQLTADNKKGAVMPIVAVGMVLFLGMAAISVDAGVGYYNRANLQKACDLGAISGATLLGDVQDPEDIKAEVYRVLAENGVDPEDATINIEITNSRETVFVRGNRNIQFYFARIFGIQDMDINAGSLAKLNADGTVSLIDQHSYDIMPWGMPSGIWDFDTNSGFYYEMANNVPFNPGYEYILKLGREYIQASRDEYSVSDFGFDSDDDEHGTGMVVDAPIMPWGVGDNNGDEPGFGFVPGEEYTIKQSSGSGGLMSPGNFGCLNLVPDHGTGGGASIYQNNIEQGYLYPVNEGDKFYPQTGNIAGPTQTGVNYRISNGFVDVRIPVVRGFGNGSSDQITILGLLDFRLVSVGTEGRGSSAKATVRAIYTGHGDDMLVADTSGYEIGGNPSVAAIALKPASAIGYKYDRTFDVKTIFGGKFGQEAVQFEITGNKDVVVSEKVNAVITLLGAAYQKQVGKTMYDIPIYMWISIDGGNSWIDFNNGVNINTGQQYVLRIEDVPAGSNIVVKAYQNEQSYGATTRISNRNVDLIEVRRNGEICPDHEGNFAQENIAYYLADIIDKNRRINIGDNDVIYMIEMSPYTSGDYQDVVAMVSFEPADGSLPPEGSEIIGGDITIKIDALSNANFVDNISFGGQSGLPVTGVYTGIEHPTSLTEQPWSIAMGSSWAGANPGTRVEFEITAILDWKEINEEIIPAIEPELIPQDPQISTANVYYTVSYPSSNKMRFASCEQGNLGNNGILHEDTFVISSKSSKSAGLTVVLTASNNSTASYSFTSALGPKTNSGLGFTVDLTAFNNSSKQYTFKVSNGNNQYSMKSIEFQFNSGSSNSPASGRRQISRKTTVIPEPIYTEGQEEQIIKHINLHTETANATFTLIKIRDNFGALDLNSSNSGAHKELAEYEKRIKYGFRPALLTNSLVDTFPGVWPKTSEDGAMFNMEQDPDSWWDNYDEKSPRIVLLPVVSTKDSNHSSTTKEQINSFGPDNIYEISSRDKVSVLGYAKFYLMPALSQDDDIIYDDNVQDPYQHSITTDPEKARHGEIRGVFIDYLVKPDGI